MTNDQTSLFKRFLLALGPAIIVASVVLGPGSILTSSRVGTEHGYNMLWVLVVSTVLMIGMVGLAMRLGVSLQGTMCDELAARLGRPFAVFIGVVIFLVIAGFQTSNNVAVLAALEPFFQIIGAEGEAEDAGLNRAGMAVGLIALNAIVIAALFGLRKLYVPVERLMMFLVLVMIIGFVANLFFARPALLGILSGLLPRLPEEATLQILPFRDAETNEIVDPLFAVTGMIATTFSIAGAFYQAYLAREKGWKIGNVREGLADSVAGMVVLGLVTMVIMITAASVLHGTVDPGELGSAADVALQLEPLFGPAAVVLFSLGIFAGAFSSFLVNAMIGGTLMSDGLGLGGRMDQMGPKVFTTVALLAAMVIALVILQFDLAMVNVIIFAQALTVVGGPVLALSMLYLATRPEMSGERKIPIWMLVIASVAVVVTLFLAVRVGRIVWLQLFT